MIIKKKKINISLAKKINEMVKKDQRMRRKSEKTGLWDHTIDKENTREMKRIIKRYGWPTIDKVGKKSSFNAWLLVQHADHDLKFQKKCLELLKDEYNKNSKNIDKANIAYLTDRILVAERKKQIFGTQFYIDNKNKLIPRPIKNKKGVNQRRKEYNLEPIEKYIRDAKKYIPPPKKP